MWSKALLSAAVALLALPSARAATAPQKPLTLEGTVARVTGQQLWLQDDQGAYHPLDLTPDVQIQVEGHTVGVRQLPYGTPVRATARLVNGSQVATSIQVQPTRPPPGAGP